MSFVGLLNRFEDLFLKNHGCLSCRREIADGTKFSLCKNCFENLEIIEGNICKKCGEEIPHENSICDTCKNTDYDFDRSRSFAKYGEIASAIVKRFKYNGKKYYGRYIAELMSEKRDNFENIDVILFVPIGDKRKRERGFNQAEGIANEISKLTNIPVVDAFQKIGNEKHQAGLSQKDRRQNLVGTIVVREEEKKNFKEKNILIIDDVFTTGATVSECARVLKTLGRNKPSKINVYTFAKTVFFSTNNG